MALASFRLEVSEIRRRTAAIWSPKTSSKPAQSGTGIWIGGNLLLTAHHVCVSDRVHYRWAGETEWVEEASVIQRDVDLGCGRSRSYAALASCSGDTDMVFLSNGQRT